MDGQLRYSMMAVQLIATIDRGASHPVGELHEQIENGDLFLWIHDKEPEIDQSLYLDDDRSAMLGFFQRLGSAADAKRKYNVEENGLCLLLAYCLEGLQHELRS